MEDIMLLYEINKDELINENKHIRVWNRLVPGTKLRIPTITEIIDQDIKEMEPFIEDYYPTAKFEEKDIVLPEEKEEKKEEEIIKEEDEEEEYEEEDLYNGYNPYPFYYPYYNGQFFNYPAYPYRYEEDDDEDE